MKILQLHNRYQIQGGEEGVLQAEKMLLEQHGDQVIQLEVSNDDIVSSIDKALAAFRAVYSLRSRKQVTQLLDEHQPDVVHVHNLFPLLSPAVYDACRDRQVPVVQTLHNYRLACPKAMFFRDNQVCEVCLEARSPWSAVKYGCYRESKAQSAVVATMLTVHNWRQTWQQRVDAFITLTEFQKGKLVQAGLPVDRVHVKPNFLALSTQLAVVPPSEPFVLFVGRLSEEKGIGVAIAAYQADPDLAKLKIVGDGPQRQALEQQVLALGLGHKIEFLGFQDKPQVLTLMQQAQALIFPSIWYEGFPLTIVEAFGCGLPPIVSRLGSMAEIVQDGENGLHFQPQQPADLAQKIRQINQDQNLRDRLSQQARQTHQAQYTPEQNYQQLMAIYHQAKVTQSS
jgi:glycosyltransferase involved in cell wall biosynthesis